MKKSIFLVLAFLVFSCHQPAKKYTQEEAEAQVLALPMVQEASKHIDKITNGKHGISFITEEDLIEKKPFYQIMVVYNSAVRFETYHIFYVNKGNKGRLIGKKGKNIKNLKKLYGDIVVKEKK